MRPVQIALFSALNLAALSGCVTLNSVSQTQIPAARDHEVAAESSKMIILGLNFDNDYVDQVRSQLKERCPNGDVRGILTKDERIIYFLFVEKRRVTATGYCATAGGRT